MKENDLNFYENLLCAIADGEDDAFECDKCGGIYRAGWFGGACPYCEVSHDSAIIFKEATHESL